MGTVSTTLPSDGQTIDASDVNTPINAIITEINGNIETTNLADDAVTAAKVDFGGAGTGIWWEEIGRTTLGSAGDTITVSGLPARKYLRILVRLAATGGNINFGVTFNNDTGSNYSYRRSANGGADATSTSQTAIAAGNSTSTTPTYGVFDIINVASEEKTLSGVNTQNGTAGAGNVVDRIDVYAKWANTSDQISRIDYTNSGTGDYAIGSEVVVLGHD